MKFPCISHIDEVLPAIKDRKDFIHVQKPGYQVIDYVFTLPDSFDDPLRMECRGIKFDERGRIIARPFHKFFNFGEKNTTFNVNEPHYLTEKLDGSMIHPAVVDGALVLMTRMGITDVAQQPMHWLESVDPFVLDRMEDCLEDGYTPIFEWTSPMNRVVLAYPAPRLTLLAVRHTDTGAYVPRVAMETWAEFMHVPVVPQWQIIGQPHEIAEEVRKWKDMEGIVVVQNDGHRVKIKAEDYVLKHKVMAEVAQERHFVKLVLEGKEDDALSLMSKDIRQKYQDWAYNLNAEIDVLSDRISDLVADSLEEEWTAKHYAAIVNDPAIPEWVRPAYFLARRHASEVSPYQSLTQVMLRSTNDNKKWKVIHDYLNLPELVGAPTMDDDR